METAPACVPAELISHRHLDCPRFVVVERVVKLPGDASLQHRAAARKLVLKMLEQRRFRDWLAAGAAINTVPGSADCLTNFISAHPQPGHYLRENPFLARRKFLIVSSAVS